MRSVLLTRPRTHHKRNEKLNEHEMIDDPRADGDEMPLRAHCSCGYLLAGVDFTAIWTPFLRHAGLPSLAEQDAGER